jgi:GxxExxY protein
MEFDPLSNAVIGAALKVQSELGPGLLEHIYRSCLAYEMEERGHMVETEVGLDVIYGRLHLPNAYRMDLVVDQALVVELKTVDKLLPVHQAQLASYLRFSAHPIGILLNFWAWPMREGGIKRILSSTS